MVAHVHLMELGGRGMATALERSIEHARRAGDRRREVDSLIWLLRNCWFGPRPVDDGIRLCNEVLAQPNVEPGLESVALQVLGCLHGMRGEFERGRELLDRAQAMQLELGMMVAVGAGTSMMGAVVELLAEDAEILDGIGETAYLSTVAGMLAEALYRQGRYEDAEQTGREAERLGAPEDVETQRLWRSVLAKVLAGRGEHEQAERLGREAVDLADATDSYVRADTRSDFAEVLTMAGRRDEAAAVLGEAIGFYDEKGMIPAADRARALLAEL